jgi:hypothetical protein
MTTTPPVRSDLAELAFLADQALTEALITAQMRVTEDQIENSEHLLWLLNDCNFAVIIRPMYPGSGAHNITLRHIGGAELDAAGPDVEQLLWGFLGIEAIFDASTQPSDSEAP